MGDPAGLKPSGKANETFSQFLARVLDQLSLSAWLPSAALVLAMVFLAEVRDEDRKRSALDEVASYGPTMVVVILALVVVGTVVTQAFTFEAIRALEGYWKARLLTGWLARRRCRHWVNRRAELKAERTRVAAAALVVAEVALSDQRDVVVKLVKARALGASPVAAANDWAEARRIDWRWFSEPELVRKLDALDRQLNQLPEREHRVLPTRLGNTLRAYEDRAVPDQQVDLTTFVSRRAHLLPPDMLQSYDQRRSRLDLYCTMVYVSLFVAAAGSALVASVHAGPFVVAAAGLLSAWLSYRGAVTSARLFGTHLVVVAEWLKQRGQAGPSAD